LRKFESEVQHIKYKVLKEVAKRTISGNFETERYKIPKIISPGPVSKIRCCIYKERAIVEERIDLAVSGLQNKNEGVITVIGIACDECPARRFTVTEACRGCLAHRCVKVCPRNAIDIAEGRAFIDYNKCVECGKCVDVCPFNAISDVMRPCKKACESKAIDMDENKRAVINREKCTECGSCAYHCPFGAIADRSDMVSVINELECIKKSGGKIYAMIAPAISTQFNEPNSKVINAIRKIGFTDVAEVSFGADMVSVHESFEFVENVLSGNKKAMISSCCPSFVAHVEKNYPELTEFISTTVSPMIALSQYIKEKESDAVTIFIGPCTSKKSEAIENSDLIDYVLTFEELEALFGAYEIEISDCEDEILNQSSYYGRIFARTGGLSESIHEVLNEYKDELDVNYLNEFKPVVCDGIAECNKALKLLKIGKLDGNFIEGMACRGGCIGGAATLNHGINGKNDIDEYANASTKNIKTIVKDLKSINIDLHKKIKI
jgi:[FeFe] hydrogenase (group B1/B3)